MKTLSFKKILTFGLVIGALFTATQNASANPSVVVNPLKVKGLGAFVGQNMTVYYALGRKASVATEASQIQMSEVKAQVTVRITGSEVVLPKVEIPLLNVSSYNMIVFVVHGQSTFRWVNVDGLAPQNEKSSGSSASTAIQSVSKLDLERANTQLGIENSNSVLEIQLF